MCSLAAICFRSFDTQRCHFCSCCDACWKKHDSVHRVFFKRVPELGKPQELSKNCVCVLLLCPSLFPGKRQGRTTLPSGKCKKPFFVCSKKAHPTHNKQLASCTKTKTSVRNTGKHQKKQMSIHVAASIIFC